MEQPHLVNERQSSRADVGMMCKRHHVGHFLDLIVLKSMYKRHHVGDLPYLHLFQATSETAGRRSLFHFTTYSQLKENSVSRWK
jgi:hypothetical protein